MNNNTLLEQTSTKLNLSRRRNRKVQPLKTGKYIKKVNLNKLVKQQVGEKAYTFLSQYVDFGHENTFVESTTTRFNILKIPAGKYESIVNLTRVNDIRWINKFFETVNSKLDNGALFIGFVETKKNRKTRVLNKHPFPFNWIRYSGDFAIHRALPKMKFTKRLYFYITKGHNRVLTKAETLGRLVSCGFEIKDVREIGKLTWFVTEKVKEPVFDINPSYGPLFKMRRIGKDGKIIQVYKFRTMHPYAEYLQDYVLHLNGYSENGKLANDFRLTTWGVFLRRYWLDELPQLINVVKGEMKLVGVRPLSQSNFKECPPLVREKRIKQKPGCFPPYVALLMQSQKEGFEAELIYLNEKEKHPFTTDIKFFFKSIFNILSNKIRSA